jgi:hypothetical protein
MTYDEIMALSGRELDAAVAEHVMGLRVVWRGDRVATGPFYRYANRQWLMVPLYSAHVAAAWPVHEKMMADDTIYGYNQAMRALLGGQDLWTALSGQFICRAALIGKLRLLPAESNDSNQCESSDDAEDD